MLGTPEAPLINAAAEAQPFKEPRVSIAQLACSPAYWTAVVTTALAALGAGVLAYPFAFMKAGLVGGGILLFTMSTFGGIALFILMRSIAYVQQTEPSVHAYGEVVRVLCGPRAGAVVECGVIFYALGACWSYLVLLADVVSPVITRLTGLPDELTSQLVMLTSALIGLALCLLRKINALRWTAVIAVLAVLMLVAALVREYLKHPCKPGDCKDEEGVDGWPEGARGVRLFPDGFGSVAAAIPLVTFALQCHIQTPSVYAEVPVSLRTPRVNIATAVGTYALLCILYLPTGIAGYARFGGATAGDIINNFSISDDLADAVRVCIAVTALCSYPMQHFPARTTIHQIWVKWNIKRGKEMPPGMSSSFVLFEGLGWTFLVLAISVLSSSTHTSLDSVFGLVGSICGGTVIFTIPGLMWRVAGKGPLRLPAVFLCIAMGMFVTFIGTAATVQKMMHPPPPPSPGSGEDPGGMFYF